MSIASIHTKTSRTVSSTVVLISLVTCGEALANSCSKSDIDFYLQRGFTHEQVIRLCDGTAGKMQGQYTTPAPTSQPKYSVPQYAGSTATPQKTVASNELTEDRVYFQTVLDAKSASLTPSSLSYVSRECKQYGEEKLAGLRDKACANTQVTIDFKGLRVVKAVKGIFLIREQEMTLSGSFRREYLDAASLPAGKLAIVRAQLPEKPMLLELPVRSGIDPADVASRLKKYITP